MTGTYTLPDVTGTLEFSQGYWRGADVEVRLTVPLGMYFDILKGIDEGDAEELRKALRTWADEALVSWNIVDRHGAPVSADADGFMELPLASAMDLVRVWLNKVADVELPSNGGSPGTATSATRRVQKRQQRSSSRGSSTSGASATGSSLPPS